VFFDVSKDKLSIYHVPNPGQKLLLHSVIYPEVRLMEGVPKENSVSAKNQICRKVFFLRRLLLNYYAADPVSELTLFSLEILHFFEEKKNQ
jgi:hypothetical protein